jgi:hypothetical protein
MKKARTLQDIIDHPMVESTHTEWDGCFEDAWGRECQGRWVYLHTGYISPSTECSTIHERSVKNCCEDLNDCRRCTPEELERYSPEELAQAYSNWIREDNS